MKFWGLQSRRAPPKSNPPTDGSPRSSTPTRARSPRAKDKFAEVGSAYEIVGDEKKREAFDRGEIDAEGKPRHQGFEGFRGARRHARTAQGAGPDFQHFDFDFGDGDFNRGRAGGVGIDPDILAELFGGRGRQGARAGPSVARMSASSPRFPWRWRRRAVRRE